MKCRLHRTPERGIALVITLVMLAIVTVMAIVFLGVSRRERASVKVGEDIATANSMADAAVERAKAEAIAKMAAQGSKLYYDLFNSRNFTAQNGYYDTTQPIDPTRSRPDNVSYVDKSGNILSGQQYLRMLANLQYDPRVPVFVETNVNTGATDFRYYLDFNRNGQAETNGVVPLLNDAGVQIKVGSQLQFTDQTGDPEWIGILERPDLPHSETNRFIGRMAYLVLPAGKTLDLNFIHNQANSTISTNLQLDTTTVGTANVNGYSRNQGVGSWEINLAAFFRELNPTPNGWPLNSYTYTPGQPAKAQGAAFDDARYFLGFRYYNRAGNLKNADAGVNSALSLPENFNNNGRLFRSNGVDDYGDGPIPIPGKAIFAKTAVIDDDVVTRPWPGSLTTNIFTDVQEMITRGSPDFTNRLLTPAIRFRGTTNRYQFYKLAAQLGVDSTPALEGKLHLNFQNGVGKVTNTVVPWSSLPATNFFMNAADLMLKSCIDGVVTVATNRNAVLQWGRRPGTYYLIGDTLVATNFSITNIQVYSPYRPVNATNFPTFRQTEYTPAVHRILQVAANIYDSMTNRFPDPAEKTFLPTVFRPVFTKTTTNIYISGWTEISNVTQVAQESFGLDQLLTNNIPRGTLSNNVTFYGEHLVIGAKKGHPNFNEMALQTTAEVARKLEVVKASATAKPTQTNEMFVVSLAQRWGMEAWNSYTNNYRRPVTVWAQGVTIASLKDGTNLTQFPVTNWVRAIGGPLTNINNWPGFTNFNTVNFKTVASNSFVYLPDYGYSRGRFQNTNTAAFNPGIQPDPKFELTTTNRVRFMIWDTGTGRLIDYVSFDDLIVNTDIAAAIYTRPGTSTSHISGGKPGDQQYLYWDPTLLPNGLTVGISNQLAAAAGDLETSAGTWRAFRLSTPLRAGGRGDDDKNGAIAGWRRFLGEKLLAGLPAVPQPTDLRRQIPFVPSRRVEQIVSWQVNDPLVHYMPQDIAPNAADSRAFAVDVTPQNTGNPPPPAPWNIGTLNPKYQPWGGTPLKQPTALTFSVGVHDPGIRKSDDWEFPIDDNVTNRNHFFANIGELGRVHRGTPWQTIYLKSIYSIQPSTNGFLAVPLPGLSPYSSNHIDWASWAGTVGTHPLHDWKLLDVFTTAATENATRGLLSVNQTNRAAWSAVLSGVIVPTNNVLKNAEVRAFDVFHGADPAVAYTATYINPATPQVQQIVDSINYARQRQLRIIPNPNAAANPAQPWIFTISTIPDPINPNLARTNTVFAHMGDVLGAPHLSVQSPFLNISTTNQLQSVITDRAMEYIPQQILSLLQKDTPRFVVYAYGQSLKPAPRSLTSDPNFFHMCTNYQITGEVTTKTVFRVDGDLPVPGNPLSNGNPLHAVVESYEILPPVE